MSVGLRILLLGMFMLAQAGYAFFLIKKGLSPVFAPVVLIIGQTLILYFSGFVSCIRTAQVLLLALGILLLAISCRKDSVVRLMKSPGFWLFLLFAATDCMLVYRERLACWDDYSHWGRMAKALTFANGYTTQAAATLTPMSC